MISDNVVKKFRVKQNEKQVVKINNIHVFHFSRHNGSFVFDEIVVMEQILNVRF